MKIAVLSDVHGNTTALRKIVKDLQERNISKVIFLGDLFIGGPDAKGCLKVMRNLDPIVWIKGNTDDWIDEELFIRDQLTDEDVAFIKDLPIVKSLTVKGVDILCLHGTPRDVGERIFPEMKSDRLDDILYGYPEQIILSGHIHEPYVVDIGDRLLVNPGSVGLCNAGDDDKASYAIMNVKKNSVTAKIVKIKFSHKKAAELAKSCGMNNVEKYINKIENRPSRHI